MNYERARKYVSELTNIQKERLLLITYSYIEYCHNHQQTVSAEMLLDEFKRVKEANK